MATLDFSDKIAEASKNLTSKEQMIGKGLLEPFNGSNAGARKIMFSTHLDHRLPLINGEKAIVETGYEIKFGDYSSSVTKTDSDYQVVAKIPKFSFAPRHHYWLIVKNIHTNELDIVERISYHHITESYGYLYNNEYLDTLDVGYYIPKDTIIQKSLAFDEYNNRRDGRNFNVIYMALDDNMEDSIIFSDKAASTLTSPLIKPVQIMINDNDIPLNIYGDDKVYKVIPDIGEKINNATLIALRKEKKEESYYAQSVDRLRKVIMSDELKQVRGTVVDVDIYCNNPDILDNHYYAQLKMYYNELQRRARETVHTLLPYASENYKMSYELQEFFANAKRVMNGDQYMDKRPFSNIILNVTVLEELEMGPGDKASNRYGGKGVISDVWPQKFMPRFKNVHGEYEYADIIFNSSTMINRENVGQVFELSLTHIGNEILYRIMKDKCSVEEAYNMIRTYVAMCSEEQASYMDQLKDGMSKEELTFYIESILSDGSIHISMKPLSNIMTIDRLADMYEAFPWVKQTEIEVPITGSNGEVRYVKARRPIVVGKQYIFRLKQFAEEHFSATSLSATNIRNENAKSRAKKDFRELYSSTPIKFGYMETSNLNHIGADAVISNLMIHSVSPQARRLVEQMYTGDPFKIDIKLDSNSKNRTAEIVNTYLKTIGRRLKFVKKRKHKVNPISIVPVYFGEDPNRMINPIRFIAKPAKDFDYNAWYEKQNKLEKDIKDSDNESPVLFLGVDKDFTENKEE